MFAKPWDEINKDDIEALVSNGVIEGQELEYKESITLGNDTDKREFLADVSSFANCRGGLIIVGIEEERDASNRPTGKPRAAIGTLAANPGTEILTYENLIRQGVDPRFPVQIRAIPGFKRGPVLLISVAKSWTSPHMVTLAGVSRFFSRNSQGKYQLDVRQIRGAFLATESLRERLRRFQTERLSKIRLGETPIPISGGGPKVVLFMLPFGSFELVEDIPISLLRNQGQYLEPLYAVGRAEKINIDGLLTYHLLPKGSETPAYLQLFRNGCIESATTSIFEIHGKGFLDAISFESDLLKHVGMYLSALKNLNLAMPILVSVHILEANGLKVIQKGASAVSPIDRQLIHLPEVLLEAYDQDAEQALRPVCDGLWQAAGSPESPNFTPEGKWKPNFSSPTFVSVMNPQKR